MSTAPPPTLRLSAFNVAACFVLAAGVVTVLLIGVSSRAAPGPFLVCALIGFGVLSAVLAVIDIRTRRLPDVLVVPGVICMLVLVAADQLSGAAPGTVVRALIGGAVPFLVFWLIATVRPGAIGGGDVKFVALTSGVAAWVSVEGAVLALVIAFVGAGLVAIVGVTARGMRSMPFGPFLALGAWIAIPFAA